MNEKDLRQKDDKTNQEDKALIYSPSDGFACRQITEGSDQVSLSEILSISIRSGYEFRHGSVRYGLASMSRISFWSMNEA